MLPKRLSIILKYIVPTIAVLVGVPLLQRSVSDDEAFPENRLRCVIATDKSPVMRYSTGYSYEMLTLFAWQMDKEPDIFIGGREYLDSLADGSVDIVVMPFSDSLIFDENYYASIPLADSSAWIVDGRMRAEHKAVNRWLSNFLLTDSHKKMEGRFTPGYEPYRRLKKGWKYKTLSPYDDLIKQYSSELGWNRTMLTAIIWQESQFHIEAHSRRGAVGLMQLMPRTASRFEADNLLDPDENIRTGVQYLKHLQSMFRIYTTDKTELMKFTLASYNAGEGRIKDCINYAASINAPHSTWNDIVAVIPDMREDSILDADTVKLGKFKGYETISYVERMMKLADVFETISSDASSGHGQSSQGQPRTQKDTAAKAEALSQDKK